MVECEGRPYNIFRNSISRPPKGRERTVLAKRCERLRLMQESIAEAAEQLRTLTASASIDTLRLRHGYVRLDTSPAAENASDRSAPERQHRPSATRLLSPNGIALRFHLIALLEAQTRTKPGTRPGPSPRLLRGTGAQPGWTHLVATGATNTGQGRTRSTVVDKKLRQLHSAIKRLDEENLVDLPHIAAAHNKHEGFLLTMEDERRRHTNDLYRVPDDPHEYFNVPLELFTNGWIYTLEDSELALLLITARNLDLHGAQELPLRGSIRIINHGLSQDAFKAHRVLDYLALIDVLPDHRRRAGGKVANYKDAGTEPHRLLFHPQALHAPAVPTFLDVIQQQLERPEPAAEQPG